VARDWLPGVDAPGIGGVRRPIRPALRDGVTRPTSVERLSDTARPASADWMPILPSAPMTGPQEEASRSIGPELEMLK
jgi:hypothetical protein